MSYMDIWDDEFEEESDLPEETLKKIKNLSQEDLDKFYDKFNELMQKKLEEMTNDSSDDNLDLSTFISEITVEALTETEKKTDYWKNGLDLLKGIR